MNIERELEEAIDLLQNRRKISIKVAPQIGEYRYGMVKAYNECLEILKDMKKRMDRDQKITKIEKSEKKGLPVQNILEKNELPIV